MYVIALVLATLVFVAVCVWYARSGYFSVYHPFTLYLAFHGFLFVFRPIVAWVMDFRFVYLLYQFTPTETDKCVAILVATAGLLSFAFFIFRQGNVPMRFNIDTATFVERKMLISPFVLVAAVCFPLGFYSLYTLWDAANNDAVLAAMQVDKATRVVVNTGSNGYFKDAQLMLASCGAMLAWIYRFRLLAVLPTAAFVVLRAGTGGRGPFVAAAAALALLWLYEHRRLYPSPRILVAVLLLLAAFSAVGDDRGRAIRKWIGTDRSGVPEDSVGYPLRPLEGMDFANLEYLEYLIVTVPAKTQTYTWFTEQAQLFTEPIPRAWWPGKPIGAPIQLFNLYDYGNPIGMTASLPGAGWIAAGWAGVVIWCGLWGYLLGWLYRRFVEGPQSSFQSVAYMVFLASLIVAYRDGSVLTIARQNIFFMAPVLLWLVLARRAGVPSLARVRAALSRKRLALDGNSQITAAAQYLPPAVARRRAALARADP